LRAVTARPSSQRAKLTTTEGRRPIASCADFRLYSPLLGSRRCTPATCTPTLASITSALLLEHRRATAVTGDRRRASQSASMATAGSQPAINRVESISPWDQQVET